MEKVRLSIDGIKVEKKAGMTVLEAAREAGVYIPTLCSRADLPLPLGNCRLCVVQIEGRGFPSSCITPVAQGMIVRTNTPQVQDIRRHVLKAVLTPLPSPRLKRPGLKKIAEYVGVKEEEIPPYVSRGLPFDREEPVYELDHNCCILCGLCVRVCNEVRGVKAIDFVVRDGRLMIGPSHGISRKEAGCRFCGACVEVCPTGALMDKNDEWPVREAGILSCTYACPAQVDIPRYVYLVAHRRFAEAAAVIREKVPFAGVLGHVCLHPCEEKCRRGQLNEPISIAALKRVCAERDARMWRVNSKIAKPTGKKVAIVGSGPAGLTAGFYLAKLGHAVTIFEALPDIGGMMRKGIPEYRLPREVLSSDIEEIKRVGVKIKTNTSVRTLESLFKQGYDAILLATGAWQSLKLNVPGEDAQGVIFAMDFLSKVNSGAEVTLGKRVIVIGGGNVAIDAARVAKRLGAKEVHLVCLECRDLTSKDRMLAQIDEIQKAEEEGVIIHPSLGIREILTGDGRVSGLDTMTCFSVREADGTFNPKYDNTGSALKLKADNIIIAIGQTVGKSVLTRVLKRAKNGAISVDPDTLATSREGVFAGGDVIHGPVSVIEAIAEGRKAASSIDKYLGGRGVIDEKLVEIEEPSPWLGPGDSFADMSRVHMPCLPLNQRLGGFAEVELGLSEEMAIREASRCLQCHLRLQIPPGATPPVK